jgi:hypothetical protein
VIMMQTKTQRRNLYLREASIGLGRQATLSAASASPSHMRTIGRSTDLDLIPGQLMWPRN